MFRKTTASFPRNARWLGALAVAACAASALAAPTRDALLETLKAAAAPSDAFHAQIEAGIGFRMQAYENARRVMLLCRSPLVRGPRPAFLDPAMANVASRLIPEIAKLRSADGSTAHARQQLVLELTYADYSIDEMAALSDYFRSADGQRARKIGEAFAAIHALESTTSDATSGRQWSWPIGQVLSYMDQAGFRADFLSAVDRARPGASKLLQPVTAEMSQSLPDDVVESIGQIDWEAVGTQFGRGLSARDAELVNDPRMRRYLRRNDYARTAASPPITPIGAPGAGSRDPQQLARQACDLATEGSCPAPIVERIQKWQTAVQDVSRYDFGPFDQTVKALPESNCAAPSSPVTSK